MQSDAKEDTEDSEATFGILSDDVNSEVNTDVNLSSLSNITETSVTIDNTHVGSDTTDVNLSSLSNITETSVVIDSTHVGSDTTDVNFSSLSNITVSSVAIEGTHVGSDGSDVTAGDGISTATSMIPAGLIPENLVLVETSKG